MILVYQQSEVGNIMSYLTAFVIFDHCLSIVLRCFCDL